ncbi:hypothetical protein JW877_08450 [bacterium]|nr:hypothetical protein [bacterium]
MERTLLVLFLICCLFSLVFAEGGAEISAGYQFSNATAAKNTAEDMGLDVTSTPELMLDIHGWAVYNKMLRLGGLVSGGYFDAKGEPSQSVIEGDESGVGFGDARFAFLPEIYFQFGPINTALGLAVGGGAIITFVNDDNGDNDGEISWYGFMRPQVTAAYLLGPIGIQLGMGFHWPLGGGENLFWFNNADDERIEHVFKPSEMAGFFVKGGIVFGDLKKKDN